jgi:hypothetical protein
MELQAGMTVPLSFTDVVSHDELRIFEMSDALVSQLTAAGDGGVDVDAAFQIRGLPDDRAVLVTPDKTFSVRMVESSNQNLLVLPPDTAATTQSSDGNGDGDGDGAVAVPRVICGSVSCHYELEEILPRLHVLRELLTARLYEPGETLDNVDGDGDDNDNDDEDDDGGGGDDGDGATPGAKRKRNGGDGDGDGNGDGGGGASASKRQRVAGVFTFAELRHRVQASDEQLRAGLAQLNAVEIDGCWRMLVSSEINVFLLLLCLLM